MLLGKPYVWGSIFRFEGQASVFWDEHGPNYRDLYPDPPPPGMVPSCAEGGVLGVLCASIGSIMVTEAIKLITGIGEPLLGRLMVYDALEMSYRTIKVRKDPAGAADHRADRLRGVLRRRCRTRPSEAAADSTISAQDLKDMLDAGKDPYLVDVREPVEFEIVKIPGGVLIPKDRILSGEALAELPQDQPLVLYCRTGVRSAEALAAVKAAGFRDAVHVRGGVTAWATQVDPSLPTY